VILLPLAVVIALCAGVPDLRRVLVVRLSRIVMAAVVGAGLSVAGVILQAVLRNPLAEPYILGVSAGGGLGASLALMLGGVVPAHASVAFLGPLYIWRLPLFAFIGSLATIFLVYELARIGPRVPTHNLLLAGVIVGTMFGSLLMAIIYLSHEPWMSLVSWLLGDLEVYHVEMLYFSGAAVFFGIVVALLFRRDLNLMLLGEEPAAHLGLRVERMKKLFFVVSSLMTAVIVASCGLIGFVGLIVPHLTRLVLGPDHRSLVPGAALAGAMFLILCDAVAHTILKPFGIPQVPVGVVTAFAGGPFFLYLLRRRRKDYWG